jgi:hypothetical protein
LLCNGAPYSRTEGNGWKKVSSCSVSTRSPWCWISNPRIFLSLVLTRFYHFPSLPLRSHHNVAYRSTFNHPIALDPRLPFPKFQNSYRRITKSPSSLEKQYSTYLWLSLPPFPLHRRRFAPRQTVFYNSHFLMLIPC